MKKFALVLIAFLVIGAALVVKKTSDYPRVTTPGSNDLFLLAITNAPATNNSIRYSDLKSSINATNVNGSGTNTTLTKWTGSNSVGSVANGTGVLSNDGSGGFTWAAITDPTNFNTIVVTNQAIFEQAALTYATNVILDFNAQAYKTLTATGNVTFTTTNLGSGKSVTVKLLGDSTARTLAFPSWTFLGSAAPTTLAATNKTAVFTVTAFGTADTNCVAAYAAEP
jgi:hypothetical protein